MRQSIVVISHYKLADLIFQSLAALLTVWAIFHSGFGLLSLYIMALSQIVSAIFWAINTKSYPRLKSRNLLQNIFLILPAPLLVFSLCNMDFFVGFSLYVMLWLGPILGIWYFILTIREIFTYRNMAQKAAFR